ncbi:hypothetical protein [Desulfohalovibrio reitneri]|uniref:hypothetical protein n=1 Tax=Desulfohalovibrio reitneri TaxID=1307759 RepID=UPI00068ECEA9|nr:hypothetical protein [Desulfohalovibrio reitneri]
MSGEGESVPGAPERKPVVVEAWNCCLSLFKVMVPVAAAVKLAQDLELISLLAAPLEPFMRLCGLPAELGLAWAAALLNSVYAGLAVLAELAPRLDMSAAQATILATMMLIAHGLPVEAAISRAAGVSAWFQCLLRFCAALLAGVVLHWTYGGLDALQGPANILLAPPEGGNGWGTWLINQARLLGSILVAVTVLIALLRWLERIGVTRLMDRLLGPVLRLLGIGPRASSIAVVGLTLGLSYGGGLIIAEAKRGLPARDVFAVLSLMGLAHALIEDTLLMLLAGGHLSGILLTRGLIALVLTAVISRVAARMPDGLFHRLLGRPA